MLRGGDAQYRLATERDDSEEDSSDLMSVSHMKTKIHKSSPTTTGCPGHGSSLDCRGRRGTLQSTHHDVIWKNNNMFPHWEEAYVPEHDTRPSPSL